jgi:hypothetical protein
MFFPTDDQDWEEICIEQGVVYPQHDYDTTMFGESVFDTWQCCNCQTTNSDSLVEETAYWVCNECGAIQKNFGAPMESSYADTDKLGKVVSRCHPLKKGSNGKVLRGRKSYGLGVRRRYKREFYYRERVAQWLCEEPPLKQEVLDKFKEMLNSGNYGARRFLSRGAIMQMCKDGRLCKYKENWKSILMHLTDNKRISESPNSQLIEFCHFMFSRISRRFDGIDKTTMAAVLKGSKGKLRHHILHVNYVHRKILEIDGNYDYHREFPLLRTPAKIHALDDVMQMIAKNMGFPFVRTPVILIPKCKMRLKKRLSC